MNFCTFSTDSIKDGFLRLDNSFIETFVPACNADALKVYIWGLYKCMSPSAEDNTLSRFSHALSLSEEDIISCFHYWQELGLVQILNIDGFQIKYLPATKGSLHLKKYNKDKYKKFNMSIQELYGSRMISTNEYNELYYTMESLHIDEDAMLLIAKYCLDKKTNSVSINYIIATAKNWAYAGVHTLDEARERIAEQDRSSGDIKLVLSALGTKRSASDEEYGSFIMWTRDWGVDVSIIVHVAKRVGKSPNSWGKLSSMMDKCYSLKLFSIKEIDDYFDGEQALFDTAKSICKNLGVRYERLDTIVDTYIACWIAMGFDSDTLNKIAGYCFTTTVRTLSGMNSVINNLFKSGLVTIEAIDNHIAKLTESDQKISDVLSKLGLVRAVNANDRVLFKTWMYDWGLSQEVINYACTKCEGQYLPLQYLNRLLATYHNKGVKTVKDASAIVISSEPAKPTTTNKKPTARTYTKAELDSLFSNPTEVEL